MRRYYRLRGLRFPFNCSLVTLLIFGVLTGAALAEQRFFVKRDGQMVPLHRSDRELVVTLKDSGKGEAARRRMATDGTGLVTDLPWAPDSRFKFLRVDKATAHKRSLVAGDPAIDEVFPVYRYSDSGSPVISTGTIALRLRPGSDNQILGQLLDDYRLDLVETVIGLDGTFIVKPSEKMGDEVLRAEALAFDRRVSWAQPNFRSPVYFSQASPSDPFFSRQWHLNNTGQQGGTLGADVNAPAAWLLGAEGQDVLIGMFDDACDVDHPDLVGNYTGIGHDLTVPSTSDEFENPRPKILADNHGTAVMGLAVARGNTIGVRGVAHLSQFTVSRGLGQLLSDSQLANAYLFARQQDVDVHINSWGLGGGAPIPAILEDAIETAFIEGRDLDGDGGDPPRGMVIVFASGNGIDRDGDGIPDNDGAGALLSPGDEIATLPSVFGVGASNDRDLIASYSNFGTTIDVLAPGGGDFSGITTTDVRDDAGFVDAGFNVGGVHIDGPPEFDVSGSYSGLFSGTSAACPIAAGVAALTLSINSQLTATDVYRILEHTAAKVSPTDADYHGVTNRSLRYGYGRIDAEAAVKAAQDSIVNGGRSWPGRPAGVVISAETGQLQWFQNGDPLEFREPDPNAEQDGETENIITLRTTDEFLVLESDSPIEFIPEDGKCYSKEQIGCGNVQPEPLPTNVIVLRVGCSLVCGTGSTGACEAGARQCVGFLLPTGTKYFAIYARSVIGRYSFGVSADTIGNIVDSGRLPPRAEAGTIPGGGGTDPDVGPKISIEFSPREGTSPLTVTFRGNASSVLPIDEDRTAWDFDIDDSVSVDAVTRNASHTYLLEPGETPTNQKTFIARLTMFDVEGNIGFAQAALSVTAAGIDPDTGADEDAELRIIIGIPGSVGSNIDSGRSPLAVELSIDAGNLVGTVESVRWDLGDGTIATSRFVSHIYVNNTGITLRIPITATVTIQTGSDRFARVISRRITVESGNPSDNTEDPTCTLEDGCGAVGPGGSGTPCGVMGILPLLFSLVSLLLVRRARKAAF